MKESRTYKSIKNSFWGIAASAIQIILNFTVRLILVKQLGEEINGLHNLFQNIANIMLLMEMGIGSAMIIHLYAPVKDRDTHLISGIMAFYQKVYLYLALFFTIVCLGVNFLLLDKIVTSTIEIRTIRLYFFLFTLTFSLNYCTYSKRSLLFAEQENWVSSGITAVCEIVFRGLQIVLLVICHQYVLFLLLMILENVTSNLIAAGYVVRKHPYLRQCRQVEITKQKKTEIFNTVKPLMVNQVANTVQIAAKSILISILLGNVAIVGYYGNYQLILSMVENIYSQFGGAFTTSFGNLAVDGTREQKEFAFKRGAFLMNWFACIICSCIIACVQDFIYLVFGANFLISLASVFLLLLNLIVYLINIPIVSIQNALGLHKLDAKYMTIQAILAIFLGFVGGIFFGMEGIFLGLLIPVVIFTLILKGVLISRRLFEYCTKEYLSYLSSSVFNICFVVLTAFFACEFLPIERSWFGIIIKGVISLIIGIVLPMLITRRTPEKDATIQLIMSFLNKFIKIR